MEDFNNDNNRKRSWCYSLTLIKVVIVLLAVGFTCISCKTTPINKMSENVESNHKKSTPKMLFIEWESINTVDYIEGFAKIGFEIERIKTNLGEGRDDDSRIIL